MTRSPSTSRPRPAADVRSGSAARRSCFRIGTALEERIADIGPGAFATFARDNPVFMATTRRRAISYWNAYYRDVYRTPDDCPCFRALEAIQAASDLAA